MRLDKFLVTCGVGSRTEVKALLKKKYITVNGVVQSSPSLQIDEQADVIAYQGEQLRYEQFAYYLLNKPKGVISATEDHYHRTVLDVLAPTDRKKGLFPVGRLDIDTHGLLLLTTNGPLAHAMLSPKRHVDKVYQAHIAGVMTEEDVLAFQKGLELSDGFICQPAVLSLLEIDENSETSLVRITIREGKFHQVKRMVQACGKTVTDLQRLSMGPLVLDHRLKEGDYRPLTKQELDALSMFKVPL